MIFKLAFQKITVLFTIFVLCLTIPVNLSGSAEDPPQTFAPPLSGDWIITGTELYTDTELIVTGDLIIKNNSMLTLKNTTLKMNCTAVSNPLWIIVEKGGILNIWDKDNDPSTDDGTLITDSTYDNDDGTINDYRYFFRVDEGGLVNINNSEIEECGKYDPDEDLSTYGLYFYRSIPVIKNTTFTRCDYGIILNGTTNALIEYVNASSIDTWCIYSINSNNLKIQHCWLNHSLITSGIYLNNVNNLNLSYNNISVSEYALYMENGNSCQFFHNQFDSSANNFNATTFINCNHLTFDKIYFKGGGYVKLGIGPFGTSIYFYAMYMSLCENITIINSNITEKYGLYFIDVKNLLITNSHFYDIDNFDLRIYSDLITSSNITITYCNFTLSYSTYVLDIRDTDKIYIENSSVKYKTKGLSSGFHLEDCADGVITHCKFIDVPRSAIYLDYSDNFTVTYNFISKVVTSETYVNFNGVTNSYFAHNIIRSDANGVLSVYGDHNTFYNVTLIGWSTNSGRAIYVSSNSNSNVFRKLNITTYMDAILDYGRNTYFDTVVTKCYYSIFPKYSTFDNVSSTQGKYGLRILSDGDVTVKNSTFSGSSGDVTVDTDGLLNLINCTFDDSEAYATNSRLYKKWWVDIHVNDTNGSVPGAFVSVLNGTNASEISGYTGDNGHIIFPITEKAVLYGTWTDFNPHNISASIGPDLAYLTTEPSITSNTNFTITFKNDTYPTNPRNLLAVSSRDDVLLTWEYPQVTDLHHFEIFRAENPSDFDLGTPITTVTETEREWIDTGGASNHKTYYYNVRAVDDAGQNSSNASNFGKCGDWCVVNYVQHKGLDIVINGSLIIWDGGRLILNESTVKFNSTFSGENGILVKGDGVLEIIDGDNNPLTENDASNISCLNSTYSFYFITKPDGKLYMNNSILYGAGYCSSLRNHSGLFISGDGSILTGNIIKSTSETYNGIMLESADYVKLINNVFSSKAGYPINMRSAKHCSIDANKISDNGYSGIYMENTENNTISNNTIHYCAGAIYQEYSVNDVIENNILENNTNAGIYLFEPDGVVIYNNTISYNFIKEKSSWGIYVKVSTNCNISENRLWNNYNGMFLYQCSSLTVSSNTLKSHNETGISITMGSNVKLDNNIILQSGSEGIMIIEGQMSKGLFQPAITVPSSDIDITGGNISSDPTAYGVIITGSTLVNFENVEIYNNIVGVYIEKSSLVHFNRSSIRQNTNYGLYVNSILGSDLYSVWLENATFENNGVNIVVDGSAVVMVINSTLPYTSIKFFDGLSKIILFWYVHVYVEDMSGSPGAGAAVRVQQTTGQYIDKTADGNGYVKWLTLHDKTLLRDGNFTANPYTVTATIGNHSGTNVTYIENSITIEVELENNPPDAFNVQLKPLTPYTTDDLTLSFVYNDEENDPEKSPVIQWFKNGKEEASLANQMTVSSDKTAKGEIWNAKVKVFDGNDYSLPVDSNFVQIANTAPQVSNIKLTPPQPSSYDNLSVQYDYTDIDSDPEGKTIVKWFRDSGSGFEETEFSGENLSYEHTKKGEVWTAKVTPFDGDDYGTEENSDNNVIIDNSAPEIVEGTLKIKPATSTQDLEISYEYYDIDGDTEKNGDQSIQYSWYVNRFDGNGKVDSNIHTKTVSYNYTKKGENWSCMFKPYDGYTYGKSYISEEITISNSAPEARSIIIHPSNPNKYDNLTVTYEYYDYDGDPEDKNTTVIMWYLKRGGAEFAYYDSGKSIPGDEVVRGDEWMCRIKAYDGVEFGSLAPSEQSVTILNAPPTAYDLIITPSDPRHYMALYANYKFFDIDGDSEDTAKRLIEWYRDDEHVSDYDNQLSIPENVIKKGESWYFKLKAHDGKNYSSGMQSPLFTISSDVIIGNAKPEVTNSIIEPADPSTIDNLTAVYNATDIDGDTIESIEVKWFRNEAYKPGFDNEIEISSEWTNKGDIWYFNIRVSDGIDFSDWITSSPKFIKNSIPEIIYYSPDTGKPQMNEMEELKFTVEAGDLDNDHLYYNWFINGEIEGVDKSITLSPDYDSIRIYDIRVEIFDGSATVKVEWNVSVSDVNRLPFIEVQTPEGKKEISITTKQNQEFIIETGDDDLEDKDKLEIKWYLDDTLVKEGEERYVYQPAGYSAGKHVIEVEVSDGKSNITESWDVFVEKEVEELLFGYSYDWWGLALAIISGIITAILFIFGILRVKRKRGKLKEYMTQINEITEKDIGAKEKEREILALKKHIKNEFGKGTISEFHYLILEREIDDALGEARKAVVEEKVAVPDKLKDDVDKVLDDGMVTSEEYKKLIEKIDKSDELNSHEKIILRTTMKQWMVDDSSHIKEDKKAIKLPSSQKEKEEEDLEDWELDDLRIN